MFKVVLLFILFSVFSFTNAIAQIKTKVYTSKLQPESVTYNGSPNPNECLESVEWGITIKTEKASSFFLMEYEEIEKLKEKIGDAEVLIEVVYYNEPHDVSNAVGRVVKITLKDEVLYRSY